jgi:hypothetical protein
MIGKREVADSAADDVDIVADNQPTVQAEQVQEMGEHTPWPQSPAYAPHPQTPKPLTQPRSPETCHISGLQFLGLVMLQNPRPAVPTPHEAEVAGNTSDEDPGQQLFSDCAGGDSLLTVPLSNVTLHEVSLYR